jgi:hypothetical protein
MFRYIVLFSLYCLFSAYQAQIQYYLGKWQVPVSTNNALLTQPFTGGLNAINFSKFDINNDGSKDFLIFDKTDSKMHAYIKTGNQYIYNSVYTASFPELKIFALMKDYNNDGLEDIFTVVFPNSGFSVYKTSVQNGQYTYQLRTSNGLPFLSGDYFPNTQPNTPVNISIGGDQIPGIYDIDNDGDLDVFHYPTVGISTVMQSFKNIGVEKYGTADTLDFDLVDKCYGKFRELICNPYVLFPQSTFILGFDTICGLNPYNGLVSNDTSNHLVSKQLDPNSSLMLFDPNKDGQTDILMTDYSCDSIRFLKGKNISGSNVMSSVTSLYPNIQNPVKMPSPMAYYEDVDDDGLKDLVFCTNNPNSVSNEGIWWYKNIATSASQPDTFQLITKQFMQNNTIDVGFQSHPVFYDIDADGDQDLFVSNNYNLDILNNVKSSSIYFYQNTGNNTSAEYTLITKDYLNLSSTLLRNIRPAFGDLDNDGDGDLVLGNSDGRFYFYENVGMINGMPQFNIVVNKFPTTMDVGNNSSPIIIDYDNNGFKDIISGRDNGKLSIIKQTALNNFMFQLNWGGLNICPNGNCTNFTLIPAAFSWNGNKHLIIGAANGNVFLSKPLNTIVSDTLELLDSNLLNEAFPYFLRSSPASADINGDGIPELILGNTRGGLYLWQGSNTPVGLEKELYDSYYPISVKPNPVSDQLTLTNINLSASWFVTDVYGRRIKLDFTRDEHQIVMDVSRLSKGLYFIYVNKAANYKKVLKFVKQ